MNKLVKFIKESYAEFKKVIWPSKKEVGDSTKVVLVSVLIIAAALGFIDILLLRLMNSIF